MGTHKRYCKILHLADDPALIEEYKRHHAPGSVWPEITDGLRTVGVRDMEIYLSGTTLVMIMETDPDVDHDAAMKRLAGMPRQAEWEAMMARFQDADSSTTAGDKWQVMDRIFTLTP